MFFEDMVGQDALADGTVGHEVDDCLRRAQPAASVFEVVRDVEFSVEVCGESRSTGCSSDDWNCYTSVCSRELQLQSLYLHAIAAKIEGGLRISISSYPTRDDNGAPSASGAFHDYGPMSLA
jgi:hypothetical protein